LAGGGDYAFFDGVSPWECGGGDTIPHMLFACFQMTFALMVPVLITGAWAEKFHFTSACLFMVIWPVLVYYPTAHWIWGGGWLSTEDNEFGVAGPHGVLDYAGGIVIHTSSGVSSLVVAVMLQKRRAFKQNLEDGTRPEPFNYTPMAVNLISSGSPRVRPMGRTCGEPDETKKNTHPKDFTAFFREQARTTSRSPSSASRSSGSAGTASTAARGSAPTGRPSTPCARRRSRRAAAL